MVAALPQHATIYSVLGEAARRRERRSLAAQLVVSLLCGVGLLMLAPQWWSLSALLGTSASFALWGLAAASPAARGPILRHFPALIAGTGTALATAGLLGLGAALFTGNGRSPYTPCGPGATSRYCREMAAPVPSSRIP